MKCGALAIKLRNWTSLHKSIAYLQTATFLKKNQKLSMDLMEMIGIFLYHSQALLLQGYALL